MVVDMGVTELRKIVESRLQLWHLLLALVLSILSPLCALAVAYGANGAEHVQFRSQLDIQRGRLDGLDARELKLEDDSAYNKGLLEGIARKMGVPTGGK